MEEEGFIKRVYCGAVSDKHPALAIDRWVMTTGHAKCSMTEIQNNIRLYFREDLKYHRDCVTIKTVCY